MNAANLILFLSPWKIIYISTWSVQTLLYVQEVVTQPKILNRTILYNLVHVT